MKQQNEPLPDKSCEVRPTADGSQTLYSNRVQEHYHSTFGALQESRHIFIQAGLLEAHRRKTIGLQAAGTAHSSNLLLKVFELGLGTGLNALLTILEAGSLQLNLSYDCIEACPLSSEIVRALNYPALFSGQDRKKAAAVLSFIHTTEWNIRHTDPVLHTQFTKFRGDFASFEPTECYDLVYWDAFSPEKQAEMWTEELFVSMYKHMETGGILVSYCAKGEIRRRLQRAGFGVERLQGPPGKREIIRATKE